MGPNTRGTSLCSDLIPVTSEEISYSRSSPRGERILVPFVTMVGVELRCWKFLFPYYETYPCTRMFCDITRRSWVMGYFCGLTVQPPSDRFNPFSVNWETNQELNSLLLFYSVSRATTYGGCRCWYQVRWQDLIKDGFRLYTSYKMNTLSTKNCSLNKSDLFILLFLVLYFPIWNSTDLSNGQILLIKELIRFSTEQNLWPYLVWPSL